MASLHLDAGIQVVILARGRSIKLEALMKDCPKPLLPVANRPLLSYQIHELHAIGVNDFTIACTRDDISLIQPFLEDCYRSSAKKSNINFSFLELPTASNTLVCLKKLMKERKGVTQAPKTGDQLASTVNAQSDVLLVNCTSIIESRCFAELLMYHRRKRSHFTMLLAKQPAPSTEPGAKPPPSDPDDIMDTIGIDEVTGRLMHFTAGVCVSDEVSIPRTVLSSPVCSGDINLHTDYKDVRAYVLSCDLLEYVKKYKSSQFSSFVGNILPFIIRCQFFPEDAALLPSSVKKKAAMKYLEHAAEKRAGKHHLKFSQMDACDSHSNRGPGVPDVGCYAFVVDSASVTCLRANTKVQYMLANRLIASGKSPIQPWEAQSEDRFISTNAQIQDKTKISSESVVGGLTVAKQCEIEKSIIGKNCVIHPNARVINSVLMDGVVVMEGASIINSILCNGVHVDPNVVVKDSQIFAGYCATRNITKEEISMTD